MPIKLDLDQQAQQSILNNEIGRRYEIWFKQTQWKLNDDDGQTGCAQFLMKNILYTKVSNQQELDCVEHTLEIESCKVQDLSDCASLNQSQAADKTSKTKGKNKFKTKRKTGMNAFVLKALFESSSHPSFKSANVENVSNEHESSIHFDNNGNENANTESDSEFGESFHMAMNNCTMIRVYFKERPPVGCIPVIDHLELNVSPLSINLTNSFYKNMMKFFFNSQTAANQTSNQQSSSIYNYNQNETKSKLLVPSTTSANSTLKRNIQTYHAFGNDEYLASKNYIIIK